MYSAPLYTYARRQGMDLAEDEDITQSFFVHLLGKWRLGAADREKARRRSYLLGGLKNFMLNWHRSRNPEQRSGRWQRVEFDNQEVEAVCAAQSAGKEQQFVVLSELLQVDRKDARRSEVAAQLGMSEGTARVAAHHLRQRFRERVRAHVAVTASDEAEVNVELRHLMNLYSATN